MNGQTYFRLQGLLNIKKLLQAFLRLLREGFLDGEKAGHPRAIAWQGNHPVCLHLAKYTDRIPQNNANTHAHEAYDAVIKKNYDTALNITTIIAYAPHLPMHTLVTPLAE